MSTRLDFYGLKDVFEYALENGYGLIHVHNVIVGKRYLIKKTKSGYKVKPLNPKKDDYKIYLGDNSFMNLELLTRSLEGCEDLFGSLSPVVRSIRDYLSSQGFSWVSFSPQELTKDIKKKADRREATIRYHLYEDNTKDKIKDIPQEAILEVFMDLINTARDYFGYIKQKTTAPGELISIMENLERRLGFVERKELEDFFHSVGGTRKGEKVEEMAYRSINRGKGIWKTLHSGIWIRNESREEGWMKYEFFSGIFEAPLAHVFRLPKKSKNSGGWSGDWPLVKKRDYSVKLDGKEATLSIYYNSVAPLRPDEEINIKDHHLIKVLPLGKVSLIVEVSYKEGEPGLGDFSVPEYPQAEGLYFRPYESGNALVGFMLTDASVSGNPEKGEMELEVYFTRISMIPVSARLARAREDRGLLLKTGRGTTSHDWPIDKSKNISVFSEVLSEKGENTEEYPLNLFFIFTVPPDPTEEIWPSPSQWSIIHYEKYSEMVSFDPEKHRAVLVGKFGVQDPIEQLNSEFLSIYIKRLGSLYEKAVAMGHPVGARFARKMLKLFIKLHNLPPPTPSDRPRDLPISLITINKNISPVSTELCFSGGNERVAVDIGLGPLVPLEDLRHLYENLSPERGHKGFSVPKALAEAHKHLFPYGEAEAFIPIAPLVNVLIKKDRSFEELMESLKEMDAKGYSITVFGRVQPYENMERGGELYFYVYHPIVSIYNNKGYRVYIV